MAVWWPPADWRPPTDGHLDLRGYGLPSQTTSSPSPLQASRSLLGLLAALRSSRSERLHHRRICPSAHSRPQLQPRRPPPPNCGWRGGVHSEQAADPGPLYPDLRVAGTAGAVGGDSAPTLPGQHPSLSRYVVCFDRRGAGLSC